MAPIMSRSDAESAEAARRRAAENDPVMAALIVAERYHAAAEAGREAHSNKSAAASIASSIKVRMRAFRRGSAYS